MVLAVSDEGVKSVEPYVKSMGIRLKVGAGFDGGGAWGVGYYPSAALVDPTGNLVWLGHPSHLKAETIEGALVGADPGD